MIIKDHFHGDHYESVYNTSYRFYCFRCLNPACSNYLLHSGKIISPKHIIVPNSSSCNRQMLTRCEVQNRNSLKVCASSPHIKTGQLNVTAGQGRYNLMAFFFLFSLQMLGPCISPRGSCIFISSIRDKVKYCFLVLFSHVILFKVNKGNA